ncbi:MAG TPA: hypothetical protein VES65_06225 [Solirubrobacteraceae bacterium]|nr:hypothetical protein [Solirubrobacteraceae bacterium]
MAAKKTPDSEVHASLKRRVAQPITTVIEDLDSVRVEPSAARLMPPWQRAARRKGNAKHSS